MRLAHSFGGASGLDTRFTLDGPDIVVEYDNASGQVLRRYVHGPGDDEALVWYEGTGMTDRRFLHADEQGSIVAVTDGTGAIVGTPMRYNDYGIGGAPQLGRFGYTGQAWLGDIGIYWYKARVSSPTLGRFLQTDPIGYGDGMNLYDYVGGDPVNARDPSGMAGGVNPYVVRIEPLPEPEPKIVILGPGRGCRSVYTGSVCIDDPGTISDFAVRLGPQGAYHTDPGGGGGSTKNAAPAQEAEKQDPCQSTLNKLGTALEEGGKWGARFGLGAAVAGAAVGVVGAGPGLIGAGLGGAVSAGGQVLQDIAFDRPALEIGLRLGFNLIGGSIVGAIVPRGLRNDLADSIAGEAFGEAMSVIPPLDPDRCK